MLSNWFSSKYTIKASGEIFKTSLATLVKSAIRVSYVVDTELFKQLQDMMVDNIFYAGAAGGGRNPV